MPRYFTHYWANATCDYAREQGDEGRPIEYAASNQYRVRGVQQGDVLYVVTVYTGQLHLVVRMEVAEILSRDEAIRRLGPDIWDARDVALARDGTSTPMHFVDAVVPTDVTERLVFRAEKGETRLKFVKPGFLDLQTVRGVRELTAASAAELDALILERDGPGFPRIDAALISQAFSDLEAFESEKSGLDIILGIPGLWPTRADLLLSVAEQTDGLLLAGIMLFDPKTNKGIEVDVREHEPALRKHFRIGGRGRIDGALLSAIARHTFVLYLIGPGGTPELAQEMMELTARLLNAGGLAVSVETAGVAHSKEAWQHFATFGLGTTSLSEAYTAFVRDEESYYSCGMRNLGLPDAAVSADLDEGEAIQLLRTFLAYLSIEHPVLADGHTFSLDAQAPRYRLTHQEYPFYPAGDPAHDHFHNPYGLWRLAQVEWRPLQKDRNTGWRGL